MSCLQPAADAGGDRGRTSCERRARRSGRCPRSRTGGRSGLARASFQQRRGGRAGRNRPGSLAADDRPIGGQRNVLLREERGQRRPVLPAGRARRGQEQAAEPGVGRACRADRRPDRRDAPPSSQRPTSPSKPCSAESIASPGGGSNQPNRRRVGLAPRRGGPGRSPRGRPGGPRAHRTRPARDPRARTRAGCSAPAPSARPARPAARPRPG